MKYRVLAVIVAALVGVVGLVHAATARAVAPAPVQVAADPETHTFWDQARFRTFPGTNPPTTIVCIDNHSPFALQTMAQYWQDRTADGYIAYEEPANCSTFWERETIDVFGADYPGGPCSWKQVTYEPGTNYYANVNVYLNTDPGMASTCYYSTIASNHRKSVAIGQGLGAQAFDKPRPDEPSGLYVMDRATVPNTSYAQVGDGLNWDWRYN